jgi:hypothetical protein
MDFASLQLEAEIAQHRDGVAFIKAGDLEKAQESWGLRVEGKLQIPRSRIQRRSKHQASSRWGGYTVFGS